MQKEYIYYKQRQIVTKNHQGKRVGESLKNNEMKKNEKTMEQWRKENRTLISVDMSIAKVGLFTC